MCFFVHSIFLLSIGLNLNCIQNYRLLAVKIILYQTWLRLPVSTSYGGGKLYYVGSSLQSLKVLSENKSDHTISLSLSNQGTHTHSRPLSHTYTDWHTHYSFSHTRTHSLDAFIRPFSLYFSLFQSTVATWNSNPVRNWITGCWRISPFIEIHWNDNWWLLKYGCQNDCRQYFRKLFWGILHFKKVRCNSMFATIFLQLFLS